MPTAVTWRPSTGRRPSSGTTAPTATLPAATSNKLVCLLCNECIAVVKEYNVKRHYKSNHGSFSARLGGTEKKSTGTASIFSDVRWPLVAFARNKSHDSIPACSLDTNQTEERELDLRKVCLLVTDGTPAIIGSVQRLVSRLSTTQHMQFLHCIIHQSLLCAKLSGDLKNTMDTVVNIVNFI